LGRGGVAHDDDFFSATTFVVEENFSLRAEIGDLIFGPIHNWHFSCASRAATSLLSLGALHGGRE
jgi:hypothetical protein